MIDQYLQLFNLSSATFSKIDHKEAMVALVYKITQAHSKPLILKVCDRAHDYLREMYFLNYFKDLLPVPNIVNHTPPKPGLDGAILMECLPGSILKIEDLTESLAYELGSCLAKIHLKRLPGYGDLVQGTLSSDPRTYVTLKFEEGLNECTHHLPQKLIEHCRRYYSKNIDLLTSVDGPCIAHKDFRPGNLLVDQGKLKGIIDWAGARASFAQADLCLLEQGQWSKSPYGIKPLLDGYQSIRPLPDYTPLIPFFRFNKAIATIGFTVKRSTWNNKHSHLYQYHRQFLEQLCESTI